MLLCNLIFWFSYYWQEGRTRYSNKILDISTDAAQPELILLVLQWKTTEISNKPLALVTKLSNSGGIQREQLWGAGSGPFPGPIKLCPGAQQQKVVCRKEVLCLCSPGFPSLYQVCRSSRYLSGPLCKTAGSASAWPLPTIRRFLGRACFCSLHLRNAVEHWLSLGFGDRWETGAGWAHIDIPGGPWGSPKATSTLQLLSSGCPSTFSVSPWTRAWVLILSTAKSSLINSGNNFLEWVVSTTGLWMGCHYCGAACFPFLAKFTFRCMQVWEGRERVGQCDALERKATIYFVTFFF